jgi:hypothetical protein
MGYLSGNTEWHRIYEKNHLGRYSNEEKAVVVFHHQPEKSFLFGSYGKDVYIAPGW